MPVRDLILAKDLQDPRAFLIRHLSHLAGKPFSADQLVRNQFGKLGLPESGVHFNYSHSGRWTLFAFADAAVGVDIEVIKERESARKILNRFFPPDCAREFDLLQGSQNQIMYFYKVWTFYEATIKWRGASAFHFEHSKILAALKPDTQKIISGDLSIHQLDCGNLPLIAALATESTSSPIAFNLRVLCDDPATLL